MCLGVSLARERLLGAGGTVDGGHPTPAMTLITLQLLETRLVATVFYLTSSGASASNATTVSPALNWNCSC